jgi:hypothetical protein
MSVKLDSNGNDIIDDTTIQPNATIVSAPAKLLTLKDSLNSGLINEDEYDNIIQDRADQEALDAENNVPESDHSGMNAETTPSLLEQLLPKTAEASKPDVHEPFWKKFGYDPAHDFLTIPTRTAAGVGSALGEAAGGGSYSDVLKALALGMHDPVELAQADAKQGAGNKWSQIGASMADNPTTLPLTLVGGGVLPQALKSVAMMYGNDVARKAAEEDQGWKSLVPTKGEAESYAVPLALGTAGRGLQIASTSDAGQIFRDKAVNLLTSIIKPAQYAKGGQEATGLVNGLLGRDIEGKQRSAPLLPRLVGYRTSTAPDIAKNYQKVFDETTRKFSPLLEDMDKTQADKLAGWDQALVTGGNEADQRLFDSFINGTPTETRAASEAVPKPEDISALKALNAARDALDKAQASKYGAISLDESDNAIKWLSRRANTPNTVEGIKELRARNNMFKAIRSRELLPDENGNYLDPESGYQYLPMGQRDGMFISPTNGEIFMRGIKEDYPMPPSTAHTLKSSIMKEVYKKSQDVETAKEVAGEALGQELRDQLRSNEFIPQGLEHYEPLAKYNNLKERYGKLLDESAPVYALEAAMDRAAARENRNPISLTKMIALGALSGGKGLIGAPLALGATLQEHPGTARALWDIGNGLDKVNGTKFGNMLLNGAAKTASTLKPVVNARASAPNRESKSSTKDKD